MTKLLTLIFVVLLVLFGCQQDKGADTKNSKKDMAPKKLMENEKAAPLTKLASGDGSSMNKMSVGSPAEAHTEIALASDNDIRSSDSAKEIKTSKDNGVMVLVPGGDFIYGIEKSKREEILKLLSYPRIELFDHEFHKQVKNLPAYYIDKFEVTNEQYGLFVKQTNHRKPRYASLKVLNQPRQPVVGVGVADAEAYCQWAGKRLPSEEEWEKAARGAKGYIWPWGNEPSGDNYNGKSQGYAAPVDVGSFPTGVSPYGAMDMAGNVYELTTGNFADAGNTMRGGSYLNAGTLTRTMFRWSSGDDLDGTRWLGFRCVMDVKK